MSHCYIICNIYGASYKQDRVATLATYKPSSFNTKYTGDTKMDQFFTDYVDHAYNQY